MGCAATDEGKKVLLALVRIICVKNAICVVRWAWALATTGATNGSASVMCWEVMLTEPKGSVH
jgi:hypothetical protein